MRRLENTDGLATVGGGLRGAGRAAGRDEQLLTAWTHRPEPLHSDTPILNQPRPFPTTEHVYIGNPEAKACVITATHTATHTHMLMHVYLYTHTRIQSQHTGLYFICITQHCAKVRDHSSFFLGIKESYLFQEIFKKNIYIMQTVST